MNKILYPTILYNLFVGIIYVLHLLGINENFLYAGVALIVISVLSSISLWLVKTKITPNNSFKSEMYTTYYKWLYTTFITVVQVVVLINLFKDKGLLNEHFTIYFFLCVIGLLLSTVVSTYYALQFSKILEKNKDSE